jgi:Flp pilus assembly protein TadG
MMLMRGPSGDGPLPAVSRTKTCPRGPRSIGGRLRALCFRGQEGGTLVEFAVMVPILAAILTGMASFSMALYSFQQLGSATSNAAQTVGAEQGLIADPCAAVATFVTGALPNWTAGNLTYTVTITDSSGTAHPYGPTTPTTGSPFSCIAGAAEMAQNEPLTVQVSYKYTWLPILNFRPASALTTSQTVMTE